ncbi:MliC family protein [Jiella marina]|uniref:MliC family protein n=1 Tax=Jiella sp. LLJ827 TaxID=2917712 RepID=UPI002101230F|nr:MliC family protein [Jiella sp. LLJ827]MCQ0988559.1 MliC family protein [Jiella sp. LLJ827]
MSLFRSAILVAAMLGLSASSALAERLDLPGRSYGGKVRAGPGLNHSQIGSTRLNDRIILLERSVRMDGYDWFLIEMPNGRTGFQWGGLMCADGEETGILTICGSQQDAELSGLRPRQQQPQPSGAPESDVAYSCNEGIPLNVRYRNEGRDFVAYVSHDSYPEVRLVQIPSGSGVQFQSGRNWMGGKGGEVSINFGGIEDTCYALN